MTELMTYCGIRYATAEEIAAYNKIEALLADDDDLWEKAIEIVSDYVWNYDTDQAEVSDRIEELAAELDLTVQELVDWYTTEEKD